MTILSFLSALPLFFKFFDEISAFVKLLQKTPAEKHAELLGKIEKEVDAYEKGGRPEW